MTKIQKLEWENGQMKKALKEIYAMCNMTGEEREEFLKKFEFDGAQFYPIAVGTICSLAREGLAAVDKEHT